MRGSELETLARKSAAAQAGAGLNLWQTSPRFVGYIGADGRAAGRVVGTGQLDYVGDYLGRLVTFDCKTTRTATAFPLRLLKRHQVVIVKRAIERGAVAFFLIEFAEAPKKGAHPMPTLASPAHYALTWPFLRPWWNDAGMGGRQSIPRQAIEAECLRIKTQGRGKLLDLVGIIEQLQAAA